MRVLLGDLDCRMLLLETVCCWTPRAATLPRATCGMLLCFAPPLSSGLPLMLLTAVIVLLRAPTTLLASGTFCTDVACFCGCHLFVSSALCCGGVFAGACCAACVYLLNIKCSWHSLSHTGRIFMSSEATAQNAPRKAMCVLKPTILCCVCFRTVFIWQFHNGSVRPWYESTWMLLGTSKIPGHSAPALVETFFFI